MLSQSSLDRVANVSQSKVIVVDQCQANKKCQTGVRLGSKPTRFFTVQYLHLSQKKQQPLAPWSKHHLSSCQSIPGSDTPIQPKNIARPRKAIGMEGADTQARGTVGAHPTDFCLSPMRLAFSLAPQRCLLFAGTGKHLLLALLPMERGKSSHPKQKIMGICFQVYSSHSLSLQVKSPELAFFLCKASFLAKANWCLSLMLSAE